MAKVKVLVFKSAEAEANGAAPLRTEYVAKLPDFFAVVNNNCDPDMGPGCVVSFRDSQGRKITYDEAKNSFGNP